MPPKKVKVPASSSASDEVIIIDSDTPTSSSPSKAKSSGGVPKKDTKNATVNAKGSASTNPVNGAAKSKEMGSGTKKPKSSHAVPLPHFPSVVPVLPPLLNPYHAYALPPMGPGYMSMVPSMALMSSVGMGSPPFPMPPSVSVSFHSSPFASISVGGGGESWDPDTARDWDTPPTPLCLKRMQNDLANVLKEEDQMNLYVLPNEDDITKFLALIIGPQETPYEGGFFLFKCRVGPTYPLLPPKVKNMTTYGGRMRFGPNIYANGKICLSILGTWAGPSWTAVMNIMTMLTSIQSLMSVDAIRNEPGFESHKSGSKECQAYDRCVRHEVMKFALIEGLETALKPDQTLWPQKFRLAMFSYFIKNYSCLLATVDKEKATDGQRLTSCFPGCVSPTFTWKDIRAKLVSLKKPVNDMLNALKPIEIS